MIPITKPYMDEKEKEAVFEVMNSGWLVQGQKVTSFEKKIAEHENVKYCCATTSCTSSLHIAMLASGMGNGNDVIVPSFTFVATANSVASTGATPIILDVRKDTYNLDPDEVVKCIKNHYLKKDGKLVNKETGNSLWGMVPVHQFGLCADMERLNKIAKESGIKIIEDAACALGSAIDGVHIGGFGNTACVSFHPRKSITTGEGGMLLTNDDEIYEKALELRNHGSSVNSSERHVGKGNLLPGYVICGYNYRMTDIQGAIGSVQADKLDEIINKRIELACRYNEMLKDKSDSIIVPYVPKGYLHTYQSYACRLDFGTDADVCGQKRAEVMDFLNERGIATRQGTHAVHKLDYYKNRFGFEDDSLPVANLLDLSTISLPLFVSMTEDEQNCVVDNLLEIVEKIKDR